jgi:FAD/FMN-containing dehydrogenase
MAGARTWARQFEPFSSGTYINVMADADSDVGRGYHAEQFARLADLKRTYDPENVFHLNQNIRPTPESSTT